MGWLFIALIRFDTKIFQIYETVIGKISNCSKYLKNGIYVEKYRVGSH